MIISLYIFKNLVQCK